MLNTLLLILKKKVLSKLMLLSIWRSSREEKSFETLRYGIGCILKHGRFHFNNNFPAYDW